MTVRPSTAASAACPKAGAGVGTGAPIARSADQSDAQPNAPSTITDRTVGHNRLRPIEASFDAPPLAKEIRSFVDWVADYTLTSRGMVLRMVLRMDSRLATIRLVLHSKDSLRKRNLRHQHRRRRPQPRIHFQPWVAWLGDQ